MKKSEWAKGVLENFREQALSTYDFTTCQRPDGSLYGTGGTCRKGTETTKKEKQPAKTSAKSKAPLDTGAMSAMSDKQLSDLSKRNELDPTQKTAISNELRARAQASSEYDKFGNQARTEAAQKSIDEHYIKKDGGYVPRPEKQLKLGGEDGGYLAKADLKNNIEFQKDVVGAHSDKMAMRNLELANRMDANGALKNNQDIMWDRDTVSLNKIVDGVHVKLYNASGVIGWSVDGNYNTIDVPPSTARKITRETRKMYETMVRSMPNNSVLETSAAVGDGRGAERTKAYQKMGFSKPENGRPGGGQYAKVVFGNVIPVTRSEYDDLMERKYRRQEAGLEPQFSERRKKLSSSELDALWKIILGL